MFRSIRTVAVIGAALTAAATMGFVVVPAGATTPTPVITSFTPSSATVGSVVTITGTNLSGATAVDFDYDVPAPVTGNSATELTTMVPLGDDNGPITVTTPGGTATSSLTFTLKGFYVATTTLPAAPGGDQYTEQLETAGGVGPFRWTKVGHLPKGIALTSSGLLTGVPSLTKATPGSYPFIVHVRDSTRHHRQVATGTLTLTVTTAP
jgi:IPT/TIG domain